MHPANPALSIEHVYVFVRILNSGCAFNAMRWLVGVAGGPGAVLSMIIFLPSSVTPAETQSLWRTTVLET